jgi:TonB family protein
MKLRIVLVLGVLGLATALWSQETAKKSLAPECTKTVCIRCTFPKEILKSVTRWPRAKYLIEEDGSVSKVVITRSSGVVKFDREVAEAIGHWQYKARSAGCGQIETEIAVTVLLGQED